MLTDENTTALIDDHRGYYPRKAHYDWLLLWINLILIIKSNILLLI